MALLLFLPEFLCKIRKEIISSEDSGEVKMGLFGQLISTGITTAAKNSTIKAIGDATSKAISSLPDTEVIAVGNAGPLLVKPTRPSEEYHGEKALEMAKELVGVGFESVTLQPVCTLGKLMKHTSVYRRGDELKSGNTSKKNETKPRFCPYCGEQLKNRRAKYCTSCGEEL